DFVVVRLNADGSLDNTFGTNHSGRTLFHAGPEADKDRPAAVAVQADGKIVVAGSTLEPGEGDNPSYYDDQIAIARLTANGVLDTSFNHSGTRTTLLSSDSSFGTAMTIQRDGKIVVVGGELEINYFQDNDEEFAVVRFNADGSLDDSFGDDGTQHIDVGGPDATAVTIDYNGRPSTNPDYGNIVIAGSNGTMVRLRSNGDTDDNFGLDGVKSAQVAGGANIRDITVLPNGQILSVGNDDQHHFSLFFNASFG